MHFLCQSCFFSEGLGDLFPDDEMRTGRASRIDQRASISLWLVSIIIVEDAHLVDGLERTIDNLSPRLLSPVHKSDPGEFDEQMRKSEVDRTRRDDVADAWTRIKLDDGGARRRKEHGRETVAVTLDGITTPAMSVIFKFLLVFANLENTNIILRLQYEIQYLTLFYSYNHCFHFKLDRLYRLFCVFSWKNIKHAINPKRAPAARIPGHDLNSPLFSAPVASA